MKKYSSYPAVFGVFFAFSLIFSEPVFADTLGEVIKNVIISSDGVPGLFYGLSYLMGLILGIWGIFKLKEHVEAPQQVQIWDPMKRFLAGGGFFALPFVMGAAQRTTGAGIDEVSTTGFAGTPSGGGLDAMMVRLMSDVWMPMHYLIVGFAYLAGIILVVIGISRMLKTEQDGPRGPTGIGTVMTFLVAGALFSIDRMIGAISTSFFETAQVKTAGAIVYTEGLDGTEQHINAVIGAVVAFVVLLGWISIVRGFFIIRGVSEGNSQASIMAGMTHLLGGGLAVNLGPVIMAVQETLGIDTNEIGIAFS